MSIFKPDDFSIEDIMHHQTVEIMFKHLSDKANAKLQKLIEAAPVVYSAGAEGYWCDAKTDVDNKEARVMFITELPKKECEHEPYIKYSEHGDGVYPRFAICENCGVKLKSTWSAV